MYCHVKRIGDVLFATLILAATSPFLVVLIAFMGVYCSKRLGKGADPFIVYKLKTMSDKGGTDSERLTRVGRFCRRYSIDELPQLINILKGDMSFIGPRPLPIKYNQHITGVYRKRFEIKPGVSGLAQINGRNLISWRQKFDFDLKYVQNFSFLQDMKIFAATFFTVISAKGVDAGEDVTMEEFKGFDD